MNPQKPFEGEQDGVVFMKIIKVLISPRAKVRRCTEIRKYPEEEIEKRQQLKSILS